jgi:uncharacterized cupin superfamily protein
MIISGSGFEKVDEREYAVEAGDVIFVSAGEKHMLSNRSDQELRYLEFYTPTQKDFIEV